VLMLALTVQAMGPPHPRTERISRSFCIFGSRPTALRTRNSPATAWSVAPRPDSPATAKLSAATWPWIFEVNHRVKALAPSQTPGAMR
jgi:hypothetical protein